MNKTELIAEVIQLEQKIGHTMGHHPPEAWMDLSLTIGQLKSLFFIRSEGKTNLRKLATALAVTPPNVTGIIDRLVEQGLVSREENPEDRRMFILATTDKGDTLLSKLRENRIIHMSAILEQLSLEELSALAQGLTALTKVAGHNEENLKR